MNPILQEAAERLEKIFPSDQDQITFIDDRGDGRHFTLQITSDAFTNRSQIERQRMVYEQLEDLIKKDAIHALRMELKTYSENSNTTDSTTTSAPSTANTTSPNKTTDQDHPLHALTNRHPVMIFMKGDRFLPMCGFSAQIIELLDEYDHITKYETFDILTDEEVRQELKEYSNWPTYPQLYINGQLIGGIDIARDLHEKGELEKILDQAKSDARP